MKKNLILYIFVGFFVVLFTILTFDFLSLIYGRVGIDTVASFDRYRYQILKSSYFEGNKKEYCLRDIENEEDLLNFVYKYYLDKKK